MNTAREIKYYLYKTRNEFENKQMDKVLLASLYQKYNHINDTNLFVEKAGKIFPKLNCGLASVYIKKKLSMCKIINGKFRGKKHTFLLTQNNKVIDITADQYGGPRVYYGPLVKPWSIN